MGERPTGKEQEQHFSFAPVSLMNHLLFPPVAEYEKAVAEFEYKRWNKNIEYLTRLYLHYLTLGGEKDFFIERFLLSAKPYRRALNNLRNLPRTAETVSTLLREGSNGHVSVVNSVAGIQELLKQSYSSPVVFFSGDHATTAESLNAVRDVSGSNRIGLLVLDSHIDTHFSNTEKMNGYPERGLGKANVLSRLCTEDRFTGRAPLRGIGVLGAQPGAMQQHFPPPSDRMDFGFTDSDLLHEFGYGHMLAVAPQEAYTASNGTVNKRALHTTLDYLVDHFQRIGAEEIYVSVDIDGLRTSELGGRTPFSRVPATGLEYSFMSGHINLGLHNFADMMRRVFPQVKEDYEGVKDLLDTLFSATYSFEVISREGNPGQNYIPGTFQRSNTLPVGYWDHALEYVKKRLNKRGIRLGVTIPQTGSIVAGDIVELSGLDYEGRTAELALQLGENLAGLIQEQP